MNTTEHNSVEESTSDNSFNIELSMSYSEYKAAIFIWKVIPPLMIIFGTVGNMLSIRVLTRRNIRGSNSFIFLTVLAVSDTLVLYTGLIRQWILYTFELDIRKVHPFLCKMNIFLVYFTLQFSAWLLVLVTFDRVFATWFPHSFIGKVSHWIPIITTSVLAVILIALNAHFLHGFEDLKYKIGNVTLVQSCVRKDKEYYNFNIEIWPWIDLAVFNLLPFLLLLTGSTLIFIKVFQNRKALMTKIAPVSGKVGDYSATQTQVQERNTQVFNLDTYSVQDNSTNQVSKPNPSRNIEVNTEQMASTSGSGENKSRKRNTRTRKNDKLLSLSKTLITLNMAFLLLNTPSSVYLAGQSTWYADIDEKDFAVLNLAWALVNIFTYSNNTINFLLYCLSGSKFRQELAKIFSRK